ncbi:hypothetical protein DWX31_05320 [Hungatella hathewayi]|uniref:Uncharacterized protein n=1 Tax=Hungatella hathewayi TaxID=154046 RepID=A0A3E3DQV0_9FIRM|nr:hypothetical protein DWX31_05320 [Hungatella hathewayi]
MLFWVLYSELRMWIEITNGKKEGAAGRSLLFFIGTIKTYFTKIMVNLVKTLENYKNLLL